MKDIKFEEVTDTIAEDDRKKRENLMGNVDSLVRINIDTYYMRKDKKSAPSINDSLIKDVTDLASQLVKAGEGKKFTDLVNTWESIDKEESKKNVTQLDDLDDSFRSNNKNKTQQKQSPIIEMIKGIEEKFCKPAVEVRRDANDAKEVENSKVKKLQESVYKFLKSSVYEAEHSVDIEKTRKGLIDIIGKDIDVKDSNVVKEMDSLIRKSAREAGKLSFTDQCKGYVKAFLHNIGLVEKTHKLEDLLDNKLSDIAKIASKSGLTAEEATAKSNNVAKKKNNKGISNSR